MISSQQKKGVYALQDSATACEDSMPCVGLARFPRIRIDMMSGNPAEMLAEYLDHFLQEICHKRQSKSVRIALPSVAEMSMFCLCHEFDILDALGILEARGYVFSRQGIYESVEVLYSPSGKQQFIHQLKRQHHQDGDPHGMRDMFRRWAESIQKFWEEMPA